MTFEEFSDCPPWALVRINRPHDFPVVLAEELYDLTWVEILDYYWNWRQPKRGLWLMPATIQNGLERIA
jgi:hypothetical protein